MPQNDSKVEKSANEMVNFREKKQVKKVTFGEKPEKIQINENYSDENEDHEPYELTKPKNDASFDLNENEDEKFFEPSRPKVKLIC